MGPTSGPITGIAVIGGATGPVMHPARGTLATAAAPTGGGVDELGGGDELGGEAVEEDELDEYEPDEDEMMASGGDTVGGGETAAFPAETTTVDDVAFATGMLVVTVVEDTITGTGAPVLLNVTGRNPAGRYIFCPLALVSSNGAPFSIPGG